MASHKSASISHAFRDACDGIFRDMPTKRLYGKQNCSDGHPGEAKHSEGKSVSAVLAEKLRTIADNCGEGRHLIGTRLRSPDREM